jgi:hypothetical protein
MIIAEISNSDAITWGFVLLVTSIASNIATIISIRAKQRREVNFAFTPASQEEFDEHVADTREHFAGLAQSREEDLRLNAQSRRLIHEKIERVATEVAGLSKTAELQNQQLAAAINDIKIILTRLPR